MSQPPAFSRAFSFSNFQAQNPSLTLPGAQVDLELNNAKATLDAVLANLALIQRDDGALKNASVGFDQLSSQVVLGFNAPTVWVTGTAYTANSSMVFNGSGYYRCLVSHTAGVFATDLAALKWLLVVNLAGIPLVNASQIAVTPSGSLTTDVQGSLQALDTGKSPFSHTQVASTISDSTSAGRALLTAADVATQNSLLGTTSLGFQSGDIKETGCVVLQTGWYYCDGSNKNRVTDAALFNAITIQQSGTTTNGSAIVTGLSDTTNMSPGMFVSGTGIQAATKIQSVDSATQVTLTLTATASATTALVFAPFGIGDGSSTFGIPNRAYVAVGRDNASGSATNITQVSTTISVTTGTAAATVGSATGLFIGMFVNQPKIPFGTVINAISGTSVTLSNNATGTLSGAAVRFSPVLDAQTLGSLGGALAQTTTLVTANLPPYTPAGTLASGNAPIPVRNLNSTSGSTDINFASLSNNANATAGALNVAVSGSLNGTAQGGTSTPITKLTMSPRIVMNFIIKR